MYHDYDAEKNSALLDTDMARFGGRFKASNLLTMAAAFTRRKSVRIMLAVFAVLAILNITAPSGSWEQSQEYLSRASSRFSHKEGGKFVYHPKKVPLHFLMTATQGNIDLCKTLLATSILGYPSPVLLGYGESLGGGIGGGSHMLKISRMLTYLNSLSQDQDDHIVMAVDAYDIHFQLPAEVMLERYHRINYEHNRRLKKELGAAYDNEGIRQTIIFGAGKKCWPNDRWEIACWTVPDSPARDDLYGNNTNTVVGRTEVYSNKQRWVNSGYIVGSVGSLRKLFTAAQVLHDMHKNHPMHSGSDQAVWLLLYGYQNYMREVARLKHLSSWDKFWHPELTKPKSIFVQGLNVDNILDPSFSHLKWKPRAGENYEYGMGVDFFSDLGHQTMNSNIGEDTQWVMYKHPQGLDFEHQINSKYDRDTPARKGGRRLFLDCPERVPKRLPADIRHQDLPFELLRKDNPTDKNYNATWEQVPLYAHLCFGTFPIMAHHNGNKALRDFTWPNMWFYPYAKEMMEAARQIKGDAAGINNYENFKKKPGVKEAGGCWTDGGKWIDWQTMCPIQKISEPLYGKVYQSG